MPRGGANGNSTVFEVLSAAPHLMRGQAGAWHETLKPMVFAIDAPVGDKQSVTIVHLILPVQSFNA